jgi:FMN phosphatase YigB (HAD superfamily)
MLTIVWDVDDVLNNLMFDWFHQKWLIENPDCLCRYEDLEENPPYEILGVSLKEYLCSLDEFRQSEMANLHPNQEVVRWFEENGLRYRHVVVTATPIHTAELSALWVMHHFGRWIRSFNFVPSAREGQNIIQYDNTKQDFLHWMGKADIFIDDNISNVDAAQAIGIKSYLVSRPWNKGKTLVDILKLLTN